MVRWLTSAPVTPIDRSRQVGTGPYSSTTGTPLSTRYSTCLCRMTSPGDGSHVSVPMPCPRIV